FINHSLIIFAETHNMVAYLSKTDASEGFNQIIDFLNGSFVKYALTVNPNIYVSCIKQFWTTVAIKQNNGVMKKEMQMRMLKKLMLVMLLKEMIVLLMEKFLLLLKNNPFHLLHHLLYHLKISFQHPRRVKKLERRNKVRVLKLRRLQKVGTSQRVETSNNTVMDDESNQRRMIAEMDQDDAAILEDDKEEDREVADVVKDVKEAKVDEIPVATLTAALARVAAAPSRRRKRVVIRAPEEESTTSIIIPAKTKSKDKDKGILVEEPKPLKKKQQIEQDKQYAKELHAKLNKNIGWDKAIDYVKRKAKEDPVVKRYQVMKRKPQTEAQARNNMMMYLKNVAGFKMDYFKGMSYDEICPIFEAKFNSNVAFLLKTKEQIEEDENRAL
nr:hypothetical protein [Tanacetum cinerariifolium]